MDAVFGKPNSSIYGKKRGRNKIAQNLYQERILNHPDYRFQYNDVMLALLDGPLSTTNLEGNFTNWETAVDQALQDDPYEIYGLHKNFSDIINWVYARDGNVKRLVSSNNTPSPR